MGRAVWALVPVKAAGPRKTRLAGALDEAARHALAEAMLAHVVATCRASDLIDRTLVVGGEAPSGARWLPDPGSGLNPALAQALGAIAGDAAMPARLIVLAGDLPLLSPADIAELARLDDSAVGVAPDRHGIGTNALSLPLPQAAQWAFHFGSTSFERHLREARRLGLNARTILSDGLEKDIDEPADLADAEHLFEMANRASHP